MAPTEYRVIAKRVEISPLPALRGLVAAGEALNPEVLRAFQRGHRDRDPRRLRADRDRTADRACRSGRPVRPGSMGRPLPGVALEVVDDELVLVDPASDPTFFVGYLDGRRRRRSDRRGTPAIGSSGTRTAFSTSSGARTT